MSNSAVYLDYNATAPLRPEALEAMAEALRQPMNASSVHRQGRLAKRMLEETRKALAERVSCFSDEIIFTGSATEANATILAAFQGRRVLISAIEHASLLKVEGVERVAVTPAGVLDLDALKGALSQGAALVSVMLANNETGIIQPVAEAAALAHRHGALFHCDAVQGLGKIPIDLGLLGADFVTLGAHKMGGPVGIGALVVRQGLDLPPLLRGGGQEKGRRAGTENIAALAGWQAALRVEDGWAERNRAWHKALEARLKAEVPTCRILGESAPRLPNTTSLLMPGVTAETQLISFDLDGIAVSAGSACSSGRVEPSHVLKAMGIEGAECVIRVSSGWATTEAEMMEFGEKWLSLARRLSMMNSG